MEEVALSFSTVYFLLSFAFTHNHIMIYANATKMGEVAMEVLKTTSFSVMVGKSSNEEEKEEIIESVVISNVSISTDELSESLLSLQYVTI